MSQRDHKSRFLCDLFDEDVVYRLGRSGKPEMGVVVENCEDASSDDEAEASVDSAMVSKKKKISSGYAKVAWYPKGNTEVLLEKKVVW